MAWLLAALASLSSLPVAARIVSAEERLHWVERAQAIVAREGGQGSVVAGPPGAPEEYDPERGSVPLITLRYVAKEDTGGKTRKFWAEDAQGRRWKVKYRSQERHTEIAATRLLWRMGYGADRVYPVDELICEGCVDRDPWISMDHARAAPRPGERAVFRDVSIERSLHQVWEGAKKIESEPDQGIRLAEVDAVIERLPEEDERRAELDSLKALAFMLQHGDSKAANQRLFGVLGEAGGESEDAIARSWVMLQDVGSSFGSGRHWGSVSKLSFRGWRKRMESPWTSATTRELALPRGWQSWGGWNHPEISEAGLRFFLERAELLSRDDLVAIFEVARFPEHTRASAEQWADAWRLGVENLRSRLAANRDR